MEKEKSIKELESRLEFLMASVEKNSMNDLTYKTVQSKIREKELLDEIVAGEKLKRNSPKQIEKKIVGVLKSKKFKTNFYKKTNVQMPPTIGEFIKKIWGKITMFFHKKNRIEKLIDHMDMMDEISLLEKQIIMQKRGMSFDTTRDEE